MDTFEPPKYLSSLIVAVNDGAKAAQAGAFAFALVGLYLLASAFSASDEDLLLNRTLAISQLSAQIPVTVSFAMMPILFVALHVFTLIRYDMLAANVRYFMRALETTVPLAADREHCRQLLANVEFIQALTAPPGSALRSRLFGFVAWVVIAGFPVVVLLAVQTNALRYQSEIVTNVQRVSLLADLAVLFWFYNRQRRQRVTNPDASGVALRRWAMCLWMPVIIVVVDLVWLNVRLSVGDVVIGRYTAIFGQPLDDLLCPGLNWGCRFLRVDHRTLVGKVWDSKAIVEFGAGLPPTAERRANLEGVFLRDRPLRFAYLSGSRLYAADMIGADLRQAHLIGANLSGANLSGANLFGADLAKADLTSADLTGATLPGANLTDANLAGANLAGADLAKADLTSADLTGANLSHANLTGATLSGADLSGATLSHADLTGATLSGADLSGATLSHADLTGATLSGANLSGATLSGADLGNGKDLTQAQLDPACGKPKALPLDPPGLILDRPCPPKPVIQPLTKAAPR